MSHYNNDPIVSRTTAAFAVGAFAGAVAAILFAPQSGADMRHMVADRTNDLKDAAGDAIERGQRFASQVAHKASEAFEKAEDMAEEVTEA